MTDIEYTPDQARVAEYIVKLTGVGGGDDPIGFLIASHAALSARSADTPTSPNAREAALREILRGYMEPNSHGVIDKDRLDEAVQEISALLSPQGGEREKALEEAAKMVEAICANVSKEGSRFRSDNIEGWGRYFGCAIRSRINIFPRIRPGDFQERKSTLG